MIEIADIPPCLCGKAPEIHEATKNLGAWLDCECGTKSNYAANTAAAIDLWCMKIKGPAWLAARDKTQQEAEK